MSGGVGVIPRRRLAKSLLIRYSLMIMDDLFRRDQHDEVTAPNPDGQVSFADHVMRRRGKRTQFSSVSADQNRIRCFGPQLWQLLHAPALDAGHRVIGHEALLTSLNKERQSADQATRQAAAQALVWVKKRREALVEWRLDATRVERKERVSWAGKQIGKYFIKVSV